MKKLVNPPSKENLATSAEHYPQHRLLKIVYKQRLYCLIQSRGVSNYSFLLKMHPGPNAVLFFTLQPLGTVRKGEF
jgi:hypothetical protein